MTKLKTSPPSPQPKQCQLSRLGVTTNDGVFSPWKGQRPLKVAPALRRLTVSPTTSTMLSRLFTSAATPTAKLTLRSASPTEPNMTVGVSSLDTPFGKRLRPRLPY